MDKDTVLLKEIDLIQNSIKRMASNGFEIKKWSLGLISIFISLSAKQGIYTKYGIGIAIVILCFWGLDAYFLKIERLYRLKYEWIIQNRMTSDEFYFNMNPYEKRMWLSHAKEPCCCEVIFSKTLFPFYILNFPHKKIL